ncbi:MAG TPA: sugar ABC transporter ATP-binding protein [Candidatus Acidoferrales bacterium]|nr:sugar ABC transporter ATP-binding protein [Candidatus Acidoferrales bacterium]
MANVLAAEGISKHYGGVYALKGARFEVRAGEVHALMGENGAGKSTLARIIAGSTKPDAGTIAIDGRVVRIASPLDAQRLGIGIIYQELDLFPSLSVGENVVIGNLHGAGQRVETFCRPFLHQVGLSCDIRRPVSSMPIGQRQLLAIARALSMSARVILMDEPASSLSGDAAERLFGLIGDLKERGLAIVYVSHKMDEIFRLADRATVLRDGETVGTVEMASAGTAELIRMMVGRELTMAAGRARNPGETVLTVRGLTTAKLKNVSFELRRGEVLGIAGLVGSGRSELGAALYGLDPVRAGTIEARSTIGLVPEDRRLQGLMMHMSVLENSTLKALSRMTRWGWLDRRREAMELAPVARQLALGCPSLDAPVSRLSGGNQQKVLLSRWLLARPGILFLDDPTRGIDVAAKQDIYRLIDGMAGTGTAIILVSSELPELLRCSDRILVLRNGRLAASYDAGEATQENIMAAAALADSSPEALP